MQNFVAADLRAPTVVLNVLRDSLKDGANTSDPQNAIGKGLSKASYACKVADFTFSTAIQIQLGLVGSKDAIGLYAIVTGTDPTGSVAAGSIGFPDSVGASINFRDRPSDGSAGLQNFPAIGIPTAAKVYVVSNSCKHPVVDLGG